jgi:hypothetical protein
MTAVARIPDILRTPFAFLFARSQKEELVAEYIAREHHSGRALDEILDDPYVRNRCTPDQIRRLLERPELVQALGDDIVAAHLSSKN